MKPKNHFFNFLTTGLILACLASCSKEAPMEPKQKENDRHSKLISEAKDEPSKKDVSLPMKREFEKNSPTDVLQKNNELNEGKRNGLSKEKQVLDKKGEVPECIEKSAQPIAKEERAAVGKNSLKIQSSGKTASQRDYLEDTEECTVATKCVKPAKESVDNGYDESAQYKENVENIFMNPADNPLSTFSIDVDTASYSNSRRWLNNGQLPTKGVVRTEEFINYFAYDYKAPNEDSAEPFSVYSEAAACPWNEKHQILQIGLKGKVFSTENKMKSNLVFLIDVSGSMSSADKLPLLKSGMKMLVNHLDKDDTVAIVVYAGDSGTALEPTSVKNKDKILRALERLSSGGSTNGAAGIHLAYQLAEQNFIKEGNNRIILATDGDFNVGTTSTEQLQTLIEQKRKSGVFLSVLGFGTGNINDHLMETLANKGNGNYNYIDRLSEAQKVLVEQLHSTIYTIAKDVKIQIEFNPEYVSQYRLIGYENRVMAARDFNDDTKDAGEIGAGHTVTALYEIVPAGVEFNNNGKVDDLKYQTVEKKKPAIKSGSNDLLTLKIRYKKPDEDKSVKQTFTMLNSEMGKPFSEAKNNLLWATATAAFAQKLNGSNFLNELSWSEIESIAKKSKGTDNDGYRGEMIQLIKLAASIAKK